MTMPSKPMEEPAVATAEKIAKNLEFLVVGCRMRFAFCPTSLHRTPRVESPSGKSIRTPDGKRLSMITPEAIWRSDSTALVARRHGGHGFQLWRQQTVRT